tara:strand:+ start:50 stop:472 length:423 start_codon:yes stop_codon:yes gene_type:complete
MNSNTKTNPTFTSFKIHPFTGAELPEGMSAQDVELYIRKWNEGEVVFEGNVCGWQLESGHRPLMDSGVAVLLMEGLITKEQAEATNEAHIIRSRKSMEQYTQTQANRTPEEINEEMFEMRAAFGPGEKVVNVITGVVTRT